MSAPTTRPIAAPATTPLATPPAPAVAAFLHYLAAVRAANVSINAPAADDDTVRVMTLHTSKGLEFPIVYLPYLVQERFPGRKPGGRDVVSPPGFREIDAPGQVDAEQRCLFYVGVTRARDQIVLTRAERYKTAAKRSVLLQLIDGAETITPVAALPPTSMPTRDATLERPEHPERAHDEELASDASGDPLPTLPTYALWELELYLDCPRKYKYARHYRFFDERQGAVLRFHRYVRHAQRVLRDAQQTNQPGQPPVPFDALAPRLRATWQEDGPVGHAYEDYYWRHAEAILRQEWTALASVAATPGVRGTLAREVTATLRRCCVTVLADEVREEPGASADAPARFTLVRQHTGLPAKSHRDDLALPLYVLATRQEHPGAEVRVLLRYLGNALRADDPDERPGETVDLTEEATKVAEKYAQPDHKRSKLDKLDEAADGIAAEEFPPDPSEHKCAACAFCYICPADPEEVEVEEARPVAPVAAQR